MYKKTKKEQKKWEKELSKIKLNSREERLQRRITKGRAKATCDSRQFHERVCRRKDDIGPTGS